MLRGRDGCGPRQSYQPAQQEARSSGVRPKRLTISPAGSVRQGGCAGVRRVAAGDRL
ncbi:hypothetical protein STRTUCAR8_10010, partial [Streptomyces turgidiscabies Car8]